MVKILFEEAKVDIIEDVKISQLFKKNYKIFKQIQNFERENLLSIIIFDYDTKATFAPDLIIWKALTR